MSYVQLVLTTDPEAWARFPALPDFLKKKKKKRKGKQVVGLERGTGYTQPREYN
jgi:hypothetical protein